MQKNLTHPLSDPASQRPCNAAAEASCLAEPPLGENVSGAECAPGQADADPADMEDAEEMEDGEDTALRGPETPAFMPDPSLHLVDLHFTAMRTIKSLPGWHGPRWCAVVGHACRMAGLDRESFFAGLAPFRCGTKPIRPGESLLVRLVLPRPSLERLTDFVRGYDRVEEEGEFGPLSLRLGCFLNPATGRPFSPADAPREIQPLVKLPLEPEIDRLCSLDRWQVVLRTPLRAYVQPGAKEALRRDGGWKNDLGRDRDTRDARRAGTRNAGYGRRGADDWYGVSGPAPEPAAPFRRSADGSGRSCHHLVANPHYFQDSANDAAGLLALRLRGLLAPFPDRDSGVRLVGANVRWNNEFYNRERHVTVSGVTGVLSFAGRPSPDLAAALVYGQYTGFGKAPRFGLGWGSIPQLDRVRRLRLPW